VGRSGQNAHCRSIRARHLRLAVTANVSPSHCAVGFLRDSPHESRPCEIDAVTDGGLQSHNDDSGRKRATRPIRATFALPVAGSSKTPCRRRKQSLFESQRPLLRPRHRDSVRSGAHESGHFLEDLVPAIKLLSQTTSSRAKTNAAPTFGWPANGISARGVKMRMRAVFALSPGARQTLSQQD